MTLTHLLLPWARKKKATLHILIVDHNLRPESPAQCLSTSAYWKNFTPHTHILSVPPYPSGNVLAWARKVRYNTLSQYCKTHGILHLLVAHHADDNAENFLIRLNAKAGISGLAAMEQVLHTPNLRIIRPLLDVSRQSLEQYLKQHNIPFTHDPSNHNMHKLRTQWRHTIQNSSLNTSALHRISKALRNISNLIEQNLQNPKMYVQFIPDGIAIPYPLFKNLHPEIQRLIIRHMISNLQPSLRLREKSLQNLLKNIHAHPVSIGKCIASVKQNLLRIRIKP